MNNTKGTYRHPRHDEIADAIRRGLSDPAVARELGLARKTVSRVRHAEELPAWTARRSVFEILNDGLVSLPDGHTGWNGCRDNAGVPQVRFEGGYLRASHLVFRAKHNRPPVGYVKADCEQSHCLTASHLLDDLGRRTLYMQIRSLSGLSGHWNECPCCGGDWATNGRVQPNLQIYCAACSARRMRNLREAVS